MEKPAVFSAIINRGTRIDLYRDGGKVLTGRRLSTVVPVGRYTIEASVWNDADLNVGNLTSASIKMAVASTNVPTRLEAEMYLDYTDPLHPTVRIEGSHTESPCFGLDTGDNSQSKPLQVEYSYGSGLKSVWSIYLTTPITSKTVNLPVTPIPEF